MKISLRRNQAGIGVPEIIIILLVVLGIAGAAYFVMNRDKDGGSNGSLSSAEKKAVAAECNKAINDKDLCKFAANSESSFRNSVITTNMSSQEGSMSMVVRYDGQGNSHTTTTVAGMTTENITLGNAHYSRTGSGTWMKMTLTADELEEDEEFAPDFNFDAPNVNETYVSQGKEACGDLTCFKYIWTEADSEGGTYTFWFDDKDYKLRRFQLESSEDLLDALVSYENVTISEPSPVQEFGL